MNQEVVVALLLIFAVVFTWLSAFGLLVMRNPYDRLHAAGPMNILPPVLIVAAVLVSDGFSAASGKLFLLLLVMIATGPVLAHAIGRAARIREKGGITRNNK